MTVWYAQTSSVNINATNLWNDKPDGTGNWLTWSGTGPAGDVLSANSFSGLAINGSVTALRLSTAIETGVNGAGRAGGGFTISTAVTVTANILAGTSTCIVTLRPSGLYTITIVGNITGGSGTSCHGLDNHASVNLNILGNVTGGTSGNYSYGLYNYTTAAITITGNVTGGAGNANACYGILDNFNGSYTINGNVSGSSSNTYPYNYYNLGFNHSSYGTVTINGSVSAGVNRYTSGLYLDPVGSGVINNGNIINTAFSPAISGSFIYNPAATNYIQYPGPNFTPVTLGVEPAIGDIRYGAAIGSNVGTCNIPPAADVLDSVSVDAGVGTYHEATAAQVQAGVAYGPSSSYLGTFAAGGGPLVGEGLVD